MTLNEAQGLRHHDPLVVKETKYGESGTLQTTNVHCTFFKMLGGHVVVCVFGNLYVTLLPEEVARP